MSAGTLRSYHVRFRDLGHTPRVCSLLTNEGLIAIGPQYRECARLAQVMSYLEARKKPTNAYNFTNVLEKSYVLLNGL